MDSVLVILQDFLGDDGSSGILLILLAAAAAFALSMGLSAFVVGLLDPVRRRLGQLRSGGNERPSTTASIADSLSGLANLATPRSERDRLRIDNMLLHAGYRSANARTLYFGVKALLALILPVLVLVCSPLLPTLTTNQLMLYAAVAGYLGWLACSIWLERQVAKRQRGLRAGFPDALDLLVVCVESGLGLAPALQRVADELAVSHPALADELALVNAEMRAGVERGQALKNMSDRTGLDDIRGLTSLLVQTMRFGTSIAEALRVYSEEFRDKRTQAAEEQAAKVGTKMIFPLVLCLFPSFFLVAVGPAVVALIDVFTKFGR
ncbi:type II secretion system F family protein [Steroidobacter sp. S1-65]|uniref:Type II secretion system F family protein n=1 Tax=Steroidobacter gossypii TaxID=2805490 RepID=A0ABS1WYL2_9GAMM|nr:type II secretion system F family protein [Steroidobacter gossypii]MBM0106072.1 type II secretion system F family protein [Steroidobacter gossypii]